KGSFRLRALWLYFVVAVCTLSFALCILFFVLCSFCGGRISDLKDLGSQRPTQQTRRESTKHKVQSTKYKAQRPKDQIKNQKSKIENAKALHTQTRTACP